MERWDEQKIREHVSKARSAYPAWSRLSFKERAKYILNARKYLLDNIDSFAQTLTQENGKPLVESYSSELLPASELLLWSAKNAEKILKRKRLPIGIFNLLFRSSTIGYQPLGVIGIISPWNYPFSIPVGAVAMSLMAGNTVVLKPSSVTPKVAKKIEEMFSGLPESVLTVIYGGALAGETLIDSHISKLLFTGSVEIGRHVGKLCAERLIPCTLELGGKDPAIICEDADIEHASSGVVWGAFTNCGQCCGSIERVYVHSSIADKFIRLAVEKTKKLRVGNGEDPNTDIGPMTTEAQLRTVEAHVEDARQKEAKILTNPAKACPESGRRAGHPKIMCGFFYEPTVITGVDHTFDCVSKETFGPLLPIMTFEDENQAVQLANDSEYGLNAYIWSRDIKRAKATAEKLNAGTVIINDSVYTHAIPQTPWGGVKNSGYGRSHGKWGFYEVTNLHHIHTNYFTFFKNIWWFPYGKKVISILKWLSKLHFPSRY